MELIWVLFLICGVIPFLLGIVFGGKDEVDQESAHSAVNPLWEEKSHAEKITDEQTGYYDHGLGFYPTQNR